MAPRRMKAVSGMTDVCRITRIIRYMIYATVTGCTRVDNRSKKTMKRILKQQNPQSWDNGISSIRLCTVELIQRRRCDKKTFQVSGAMVHACALLMYFVLYLE